MTIAIRKKLGYVYGNYNIRQHIMPMLIAWNYYLDSKVCSCPYYNMFRY